jgi:hypothetical protein
MNAMNAMATVHVRLSRNFHVHVHSGHIRFSYAAFLSAFLRIIGDFLLNNGVDIKE